MPKYEYEPFDYDAFGSDATGFSVADEYEPFDYGESTPDAPTFTPRQVGDVPPDGMISQAIKGVAGGIQRTIGMAGDVVHATGALTQNEWLQEKGKSFSDKMKEWSETGWEAPDPEVLQGWRYPGRKIAYLVGSGIPQAAAMFIPGTMAVKGARLAGMSAKAASVAGAIGGSVPIGMVVLSDTYREGREAGLTHNQVLPYAFASGAGEAVLESILPLSTWMKGGTRLKQALKVGVQEGGEEVIQSFWTNALKVMGWKGTENLYRDLTEGLIESGIVGMGTGAALGAVRPPTMTVEDVADEMYNRAKDKGVKNPKTDKAYTRAETLDLVSQHLEELNRAVIKAQETSKTIGTDKPTVEALPDLEEADVVTLNSDGRGGYDINAAKEEGPKLPSVTPQREKVLNDKTRSVFDTLSLKYMEGQKTNKVGLENVPSLFKSRLIKAVRTNPVNSQNIVKNLINSNDIYTHGGEIAEEGAGSPRATIYFPALLNFNINPTITVEELVLRMTQLGIKPDQLTVRGLDNKEAGDTILREWMDKNKGIPEIAEVTPDIATTETAPDISVDQAADEAIDQIQTQEWEALDKEEQLKRINDFLSAQPEETPQTQTNLSDEEKARYFNRTDKASGKGTTKPPSSDRQYNIKTISGETGTFMIEGEGQAVVAGDKIIEIPPKWKQWLNANWKSFLKKVQPKGVSQVKDVQRENAIKQNQKEAIERTLKDINEREHKAADGVEGAPNNVVAEPSSNVNGREAVEYDSDGNEIVADNATLTQEDLNEKVVKDQWMQELMPDPDVIGHTDTVVRGNESIAKLENLIAAQKEKYNRTLNKEERAVIQQSIVNLESQVNITNDFLQQLNEEGEIYSVEPLTAEQKKDLDKLSRKGELEISRHPKANVKLNKHFLNIKTEAPIYVLDTISGYQVELVNGAYRLINTGNGKIMISDGIQIIVNAEDLYRIERDGGDFTNEPNIAAGGQGFPFKKNYGEMPKIEKTDAPNKETQEFALSLKLMIKAMNFVGITEERFLKFIGPKMTKNLTKTVNDAPRTMEKIIKGAFREKRLAQFASMMGLRISDMIHRGIRDHVVEEFKNKGIQPTKEQVMKRLDEYSKVMTRAAEEIIPVKDSINKIYRSNVGIGGAHQPGSNTTNSEADAFVKEAAEHYLAVTGQRAGPQQFAQWAQARPELFFFGMLPAKLKNWVIWAKSNIEDPIFFKEIDTGVLDRADNTANRLRGYVKRPFDFESEEARKNYMSGILSGKGVPQRRYRTQSEWYQATGTGAHGKGLIPVDNFESVMGVYAEEGMHRVFQGQTIKSWQTIANPDNPQLGIITYENEAAKATDLNGRTVEKYLTDGGYVKVKEAPGLVEHWRGAFAVPWVRQDAAQLLRQFYQKSDTPAALKTWNKLNGYTKRVIMLSPYQFALQIISSPMLWFSPKNVWKLAIKPAITFQPIFAPLKKKVHELYKNKLKGEATFEDPLSHLENPDYNQELLNDFIAAGANSFNIDWVFKNLYDSAEVSQHPDKRAALEEIQEMLGGKFGIDKAVFNEYVARNMYEFMTVYYNKLKADGLSHQEAVEGAVKLANDQSGMLDSNIFGSEGPILQALMFARNFTWSFLRQVTGATYPAWKHFHEYRVGKLSSLNSLLHADVQKSDMDKLSKYYIAHLGKILFTKMAFIGLVQWAIMAAWKREHPEDVEEGDEWFFNNAKDPGKFGMIKLPWKDPSQAGAYVDPLLWREISQFINLFPPLGRGPGAWVKNKVNVGVRTVVEQMANVDYKGKPITDTSGAINWEVALGQRVKHFGKSVLPSFVRESPKVSPFWNLTYLVGMPLKTGARVGPGEDLEQNLEYKRAVDIARWEDSQVGEMVYNATEEELLEMVSEGIITPRKYLAIAQKRMFPGYTFLKQNRSKIIDYFMKKK